MLQRQAVGLPCCPATVALPCAHPCRCVRPRRQRQPRGAAAAAVVWWQCCSACAAGNPSSAADCPGAGSAAAAAAEAAAAGAQLAVDLATVGCFRLSELDGLPDDTPVVIGHSEGRSYNVSPEWSLAVASETSMRWADPFFGRWCWRTAARHCFAGHILKLLPAALPIPGPVQAPARASSTPPSGRARTAWWTACPSSPHPTTPTRWRPPAARTTYLT